MRMMRYDGYDYDPWPLLLCGCLLFETKWEKINDYNNNNRT